MLVLREECKHLDILGDDFQVRLRHSAPCLVQLQIQFMRQCSHPSLLTPIASVRNFFTVDVKRSIVPALLLEVELQSQELYERDVGQPFGLNVLYDVTYKLSLWSFPAHPTLSTFLNTGRSILKGVSETRIDGPCQGPLEA